KSDGTLASKTRTPQTLSVAADGSINSFLLTNSAPHFSGAIGNDGKVMLLVMNPDSLNDRVLAVAVKKPATQTISLSGKVQDPSGNYVGGIKVEVAGNASIPAVYTNSNGQYTVTGIPSGQDFTLRFTMNGALPTYTPIFNLTENTTLPTYFRLYPANWTTNPANPANMGIINGRIRESGANWETSTISGATVSPSTGTAEYSINGYTIGGESTFANGQWFVRNVTPDTVVIVAGTKDGTTIPSRRYMAFADGVTSGALFATADTGTIWVSGKIMNGNTPVGGAAVAKVTDNTSGQTGTPGTTTKSDGSFTLTGLPSGSLFYLKVTKDTFVPSYVTYNSTSNYTDYSRPYPLFTQAQLNNMGIQSGRGMILGKVRDNHDPDLGPVEGVTISYTSSQGKTYRVMYNDGTNYVAGSATYGNGSFAIFDVAEGDTVTVKATKACWNFSDRVYITHANSTVLSSMKGVHAESCGEETAIQNVFQTAVGLYNQKNEAFFTNYVSQNYFNNGQSYNAFLSDAQNEWANPNFQQMTYTVNGVTITGSDTATINVTWGTGENENIYMKNEGGTWKLYGNQEKYRIDAYSFRQQYNIDNTYHTTSNKYYAGFSIDDPNGSITTATVSGTGIGGSLNFSKVRGNLWFPQPVEFGANPPSNATYTITITDASGQHTYNRTVNGGVAAYATNLKPAGDVSGNITFTFNGISGGQRYHIELFDANWNWKWNTENDNASTSIVYTGPPLQTGTYRFIVSSFIGDNQSQTWEQFNYTASSTPTISFTGKITDVVGNAIQGAEVTKEGDSNIKTLTDGNGDFTLTGLPSGTPFSIRLYKDGFVPVFSAIVNSTSNLTSPRPFKLFTPSQIVSWGIQGTKGVINGAVADINNSSTGLSGATLTATGSGGKSYTVTYEDAPHHFGGTATSANGHYYVLNVDDMDTVTVSVTLPGYSFMQTQRTFVVHAGAMNEGGFFGESTGASETISLTPGWNFISFPSLPTDESIDNVLKDISSNVRIIWGYDNASKAWKRYKPGVSDNTLTTIEGGKGYWVYMNASGNIDMTGWTDQSKTVPLAEGWNLVGYNGADNTDVATALNGISGKWSIVWYWKDNQWYAKHESSNLSVPELDKFKKGGAYWIKTGQATNWTQP
ncbi:MAG: carboxypeptidase regulatory-like domain-containing protein, partial [Syntrophorhabdaceae bacterium]|nr:carboxypeptidase regulatory-like domain-containing protein [Syntrophorhabdaceae bacterium]